MLYEIDISVFHYTSNWQLFWCKILFLKRIFFLFCLKMIFYLYIETSSIQHIASKFNFYCVGFITCITCISDQHKPMQSPSNRNSICFQISQLPTWPWCWKFNSVNKGYLIGMLLFPRKSICRLHDSPNISDRQSDCKMIKQTVPIQPAFLVKRSSNLEHLHRNTWKILTRKAASFAMNI